MTNCLGFFGVMSSGKGVLSTNRLRYYLNKKPRRVISNCWLRVPGLTRLTTDQLYLKAVEVLKTKDSSFFKDSYLYVTELHTLLESRSSSSLVNKNFTQFVTQIGKLNCKFIYDSQLSGQVDVRVREFTPKWYICERYVLRDGILTETEFWEDRKVKEQIYVYWYEQMTDLNGVDITLDEGIFIPSQEDYDFYNTSEIITMDREKYMRR